MNIRADNLYKSFQGNEVLKGASLEIPEGQITAIIGGSGQGKTVFLRNLIGLMQPDKGCVEIDGIDIARFSERKLLPVRRRMGVVFQSGGLMKSLNVEENIGLYLKEQNRVSVKEIKERVAVALDDVGMAGKQKLTPDQLSGGMIKRVAIARALTIRPEVIFYDEPTTGLDPPLADQVDDLIAEVNEKFGVTSVVVTHDMQSVFKIADSVHMLYDGVFIASGSPGEFLKNQEPRVREFLRRHELVIRSIAQKDSNN